MGSSIIAQTETRSSGTKSKQSNVSNNTALDSYFLFFTFFFFSCSSLVGGKRDENLTVSQRDNDHRERDTSSPTEMICEVHTSLPLCRHVTASQVMGGSTEAHQPSGLGLVTISSSLLVNQPIRDFSYHPIATLSLSLFSQFTLFSPVVPVPR